MPEEKQPPATKKPPTKPSQAQEELKEAVEEANAILEDKLDQEEEATPKKQTIIDKIRSTVRQRKRNPKATTQRYLPIAEIRNDTVVLKNGGLRALLMVEPLNFNLKSETEQEGIISRYQNFLNTLTFPIQIVVTSTRVNIDPYINNIRMRAGSQKNGLLRDQSLMYAAFVEKLVEVADIMQKSFYVVVPQDDQPPKRNSLAQFMTWFKTDDSSAKISQRNQRFGQRSILLRDRVNLVQSSLHNVGIQSRRLNTQDLIETYYKLYNPLTSQEQKLPTSLNTEGLVI
ncbi:MAG: hypothetical protein K9M03_03195 [Kiritimatiellales bacterium]|nr:hypothetical protein [Kiritimatiellales bacterium]